MNIGHYIKKLGINGFDEKWSRMENLIVETYQLTVVTDIEGAVPLIRDLLNMEIVDKTGVIVNNNSHVLKLSGIVYGGIKLLASVRMVVELNVGVNVEISVKSDVLEISQLVADALG